MGVLPPDFAVHGRRLYGRGGGGDARQLSTVLGGGRHKRGHRPPPAWPTPVLGIGGLLHPSLGGVAIVLSWLRLRVGLILGY